MTVDFMDQKLGIYASSHYNTAVKNYVFDYQPYQEQLLALLKEIEVSPSLSRKKLAQWLKRYPKDDGSLFSKDQLITAYRHLAGTNGLAPFSEAMMAKLRMKPIRTASGVTPVTVLTKPFPCPGKCIFCPNDVRMPKSYLSDEPGAQRAERNFFDPYLQTYNRLQALYEIGHNIDKVELIVLGGTWSYYPEPYQIWFIKECFRALNDFGQRDDRVQIEQRYEQMNQQLRDQGKFAASNSPETNKQAVQDQQSQISKTGVQKTYNQVISEMYVAPERLGGFDQYQSATWQELEAEHFQNETTHSRCVGLVIETRPDNISEAEVKRIRRLGCTKTQIGIQSVNDEVLEKNHRGHDVAATRRAFRLLRQAGFKIHGHWMANLYGSSVQADQQDYTTLFSDPDFRPDELKIYPCSLIESAELMDYYQKGVWKPYSHQELLEVLLHVLQSTPAYCRLTRVIRDIPSTDIVVGNKKTNFRQIAEQELAKQQQQSVDIRAREIRQQQFDPAEAKLSEIHYETSCSHEVFIQFTAQDKLISFLRLSLPTSHSFIDELADSAIIREIHVYGPAVEIGQKLKDKAQHGGFGTRMIEHAKKLARQGGYQKLAVISGIGTKEYYRKKGFSDGQLYQFTQL